MKEAAVLLLGLFLGGCGYLATNFWFSALLRYVQLRHDITSSLIFFGNAINPENVCDMLKRRYEERIEANRRHAAEIAACYYRLPFWYRWYLKWIREDPLLASKNLVGLCNCSKESDAGVHIEQIKRALHISEELDV